MNTINVIMYYIQYNHFINLDSYIRITKAVKIYAEKSSGKHV